MSQGKIVMMHGQPREFLAEALGNGLLNGDALKAADAVMVENAALRRENAILKGRLAEQRKVNKSYRGAFADALKYQFDAQEGWRYSRAHRWQMMFAAAGLAVALTCLAFALAITYV